MPVDAKTALDQIDDVLQKTTNNGGRTGFLESIALYCSAISRLSPSGSEYLGLMQKISNQPIAIKPYARDEEVKADRLRGILSALRADYEAGRMETFRELVHASLFTDFLTMAEHLLRSSYKDPAAVLVGGVLEQHLRKLCEKHGVSLTSPPKLNKMNDDLAKQGAYAANDQKQVTAWAAIRNNAAHAEYEKYTDDEIKTMITWVKDFIKRIPA